jgi:hypothetical protein
MAKLLTSRPTWQDRRGARLIRPGGGRPAASASVPCVYANLVDSDAPTTVDLDPNDPPRLQFANTYDYPRCWYYGGTSPATATSSRFITILLKFERAVDQIGQLLWPLAASSTQGVGAGLSVEQEDWATGFIDWNSASDTFTKAGFGTYFHGITDDYDVNTVTWNTKPTLDETQYAFIISWMRYIDYQSNTSEVKMGRVGTANNIFWPVYVGAYEGGPYYGLQISCDVRDGLWSGIDAAIAAADLFLTNTYAYVTTDILVR